MTDDKIIRADTSPTGNDANDDDTYFQCIFSRLILDRLPTVGIAHKHIDFSASPMRLHFPFALCKIVCATPARREKICDAGRLISLVAEAEECVTVVTADNIYCAEKSAYRMNLTVKCCRANGIRVSAIKVVLLCAFDDIINHMHTKLDSFVRTSRTRRVLFLL